MAEWIFLYSHLPGPWYLPGPCWHLNLEPSLRDAHLSVLLPSRRSCIASGRTWLTPWRRASRRRTSRCGHLGWPLCRLSLLPCASLLLGQCSEGARGFGGASTLLAAGFVLPQLAPCSPWGPLRPVSLVDVRGLSPRPPVPNSGLSLLAQHDHPVFHAPRARLPGLEPAENPFPSTPGAWHLQLPSWSPQPPPCTGH